MKSVSLIDYGAGNLKSVSRALTAVGGDVNVISRSEEISVADRIVLPGVGAFRACASALRDAGLWDGIKQHVDSGKPFLGICVGMQLMFETGEEFGVHDGLGFIKGSVSRLPEVAGLKIPMIGWKKVQQHASQNNFDISDDEYFYFVHSFAGTCAEDKHLLASYKYGSHSMAAVVGYDNILGTQFHPEKSGKCGLLVLSRFLES